MAAPQAEGKSQHKLTASTFRVLEAGGGGDGCLGQRGPCSHPCGCDGAQGTGPILLQMEVAGSVRDGGTMSKGMGWFLQRGQMCIEQALSLSKIIHGFSSKKAQQS